MRLMCSDYVAAMAFTCFVLEHVAALSVRTVLFWVLIEDDAFVDVDAKTANGVESGDLDHSGPVHLGAVHDHFAEKSTIYD